jgi:hypothetical protein
MTSHVPGGLIAAALGLTSLVAYQALAPASAIPDPPAVSIATHIAAPVAAYAPPSRESYAIVNERPLFDSARRPIAEAQGIDTTARTRPDLTLIGVVIGPRGAVALLRAAGAPGSVSVREGASIQGWQLAKVTSDHVVLRSGVDEFTISIRGAQGVPQPDLKKQMEPADAPPPTAPSGQ